MKHSGVFHEQTSESLREIITALASGEKLPAGCKDHQLKGELRNYRECHIKGDLLLVYQIQKEELLLVLVDMGTHSYLGI